MSNFTMGTILGKCFPQAQVHTVHRTSAKFLRKLFSELYIGVHLKGSKQFGSEIINRQFFHRKTVFKQKYCLFLGELIFPCKIGFLAGSNLQVRIKPDIFSRFSQPENFPRFKPDHLLLKRARFSGDNLCYNLTFLAGLNQT